MIYVILNDVALCLQLSLGSYCISSRFLGKGSCSKKCNVLTIDDHLLVLISFFWISYQTTFKGRVFMTHATKAIYRLLLSDYVEVSKVSVEDMLFDEQDILHSMERIEVCHLFKV